MLKLVLNGDWMMRELGVNQWMFGTIPGSVLSILLHNQKIDDPYWRTNEYEARELFRKDYEFQRDFVVTEDVYRKEKIELVCEGIDTLGELYINGSFVAKTDNMHRTYRFDVREFLTLGINHIRVILRSPIAFIESYIPEEGKEITFTNTGVMKGNQYLRKAQSMFGWDWGAQIPDAGIWRDIYIEAHDGIRLDEIHIRQIHEENFVYLDIHTKLDNHKQREYGLQLTLKSPQGEILIVEQSKLIKAITQQILVKEPQIWWPRGYGEQPLYTLTVELLQDGEILDQKEYRIGLRTITVSREKDQWGDEFTFKVNGIKIFAKGANYIPEDVIYSRISKEKIKYLIEASIRANYNCLRVWGGGYYASDYFYDLCDIHGILVWQDLMYACSIYDFTAEFEQNIVEETKDNVKRLRHHPSLALWCGNNEMESAWTYWGLFKDHSSKLRVDYIKQFEYVLPKLVASLDPDTFYWVSSPSSGGGFDHPADENRGDVHYWGVWHELKPFEDYRNYYFRFCSEFGFQSFPSMKTIETFALPEDQNIFSQVMESHQKNDAANGKILYYISANFLYPKDFRSLLYVSQILQGMAIKCGVEHWRRNRGRCMGTLYWQLNDNWPVASWSSVDYYGRWKALHYMAKRFYAPIAGSISRDGTKIEAFVQNETREDTVVYTSITLKSLDFKVLDQQNYEMLVPALSTGHICTVNYDKLIEKKEASVFIEVDFCYGDGSISHEVETFVPYKHLKLQKPRILVDILEEENQYEITLQSNTFTPFVALDFYKGDGIFSDNFIHLTGKSRNISIAKEDIQGQIHTCDDLKRELVVQHLYETYTVD